MHAVFTMQQRIVTKYGFHPCCLVMSAVVASVTGSGGR